MSDILIRGYFPGALGRVTELHGVYYQSHWGFDLRFEAEVATELAEFLGRFDPATDGFWVALADDRIVGSVTIDGGEPTLGATPPGNPSNQGARLRWFVLDETQHGRGIGKRLMAEAMNFCRRVGYPRVYLWTFAGLDAARGLYERHGFVLHHEEESTVHGPPVRAQLFEWFAEAGGESREPGGAP